MEENKINISLKKLITISLFLSIIFLPIASESGGVPSSARSRIAIKRVEPSLKKELARAGLIYGAPIYIRIFKKSMKLEIWMKNNNRFTLFKTYEVCTYGSGGLGPKLQYGDGKAPEGFYFVTPNQLNPLSTFHLSFNLGYPNAYDRAHGRTGSALMVHGSCASIGCFAMTNENIEEIFALAVASFKNEQSFFRVHIFPFKMTQTNLDKHRNSKWHEFWKNLKQGYDYFENNGYNPPNVTVRNARYIFEPSK